jgi:hypothetical protein
MRAFNALRERAEALGIPPSRAICTGDVVAYCGEPEETTQAVRDWGCHVVAGNCGGQLAASADDCACGFDEGTECAGDGIVAEPGHSARARARRYRRANCSANVARGMPHTACGCRIARLLLRRRALPTFNLERYQRLSQPLLIGAEMRDGCRSSSPLLPP